VIFQTYVIFTMNKTEVWQIEVWKTTA